jgi:hypothetical protein
MRSARNEPSGWPRRVDRLGFIELLAERAPEGVEPLAYLGAGPLEGYLDSNPDVPAVENAAKRSERFRTALRCAWADQQNVAR